MNQEETLSLIEKLMFADATDKPIVLTKEEWNFIKSSKTLMKDYGHVKWTPVEESLPDWVSAMGYAIAIIALMIMWL